MNEAVQNRELREKIEQDYEWGFVSDIEQEFAPKGLSEDTVRFISAKKNEPEWMLEWRLKAYRAWLEMEEVSWAKLDIPAIDYQDAYYYAAPKAKEKLGSLDEVDPEILRDLLAQLAVLDGFVHCASPPADAGPQRDVRLTAPSAPRTALPTTPMCGFTRQCASSAQSDGPSCPEQAVMAIGPSTASTISARLISFAVFASEKPPPAPRTLRSRPWQASWPISFWAVGSGTPVSLESSVALRRAPAGRRAAAVINTTA